MMIEKIKSVALAGAFVAASAVSASALMIDVTNSPDLSLYAGSSTDLAPGTAWVEDEFSPGTFFEPAVVSGSESGEYRSPFEGSDYADAEFFTVGSPAPNSANFAELGFNTARTVLSLLWGSIDTYNGLIFFNGDEVAAIVGGQDVLEAGADPEGLGAVFVSISGIGKFTSVGFFSDYGQQGSVQPAFEFSNVAAVPLPAGGVLLLTALGGLAIARRRKS